MTRLVLLAAVSLTLAACTQDDFYVDPMDGSSEPEAGLPAFAADCPLRSDYYTIDRYTLPASAEQASAMGLNLDEDELLRPDNAIGQVYSLAASFADLWAAKEVSESVQWSLEIARCADDSDDVIAVWLLGPNDERIAPAVGQLDEDGRYAARRGVARVPASAFFDGGTGAEIHWSQGRGVSLSATATADGGLAGTLAFAFEQDADVAIVVGIQDAAVVGLATDPACTSGSPDCFWTSMFDDDGDGAVTFDEVQTSAAVTSLLAPDVDLLDGDGVYWPRHDGLRDSMSFGFEFHAIAADR